MSRLLLLLALAVMAYSAYRHLMINPLSSPKSKTRIDQDMVRCEHCGIHLPVNESVQDGGHHYCSDDHLKLDRSGKK